MGITINPNMSETEVTSLRQDIISKIGKQDDLWKKTAYREDVFFNKSTDISLVPVLQREYTVLDNNPNKFLTTFRAVSCIVVVVFGENKTGMIHIDQADATKAIFEMMKQFHENELQLWMIGGEKEKDGNITNLQHVLTALGFVATKQNKKLNIEYQMLADEKYFPSRRFPVMNHIFLVADRLSLQMFGKNLPNEKLKKPDDAQGKKWDETGGIKQSAQHVCLALAQTRVTESLPQRFKITEEELSANFSGIFCKEYSDLLIHAHDIAVKTGITMVLQEMTSFAIDPVAKKVLLVSSLASERVYAEKAILMRWLQLTLSFKNPVYVDPQNFVPGNQIAKHFNNICSILDDIPHEQIWSRPAKERLKAYLINEVIERGLEWNNVNHDSVYECWFRLGTVRKMDNAIVNQLLPKTKALTLES